jgi:hypothetical protein
MQLFHWGALGPQRLSSALPSTPVTREWAEGSFRSIIGLVRTSLYGLRRGSGLMRYEPRPSTPLMAEARLEVGWEPLSDPGNVG